jgi:hypothetical protein
MKWNNETIEIHRKTFHLELKIIGEHQLCAAGFSGLTIQH